MQGALAMQSTQRRSVHDTHSPAAETWVSGHTAAACFLSRRHYKQPDDRARRKQTPHGIAPKILTRQRKPPMKRPTFGIAAGYGRPACTGALNSRGNRYPPGNSLCPRERTSACLVRHEPALQVAGDPVRSAAMAESSTTAPRELPRKLGLVTGMAVVVGVIIGSGIFRVPSPIAESAGSLTGIALVWILGGIISLCGALSVAELATMYPAAGGPYVYLREAYGRPLAFLFGWMWLLTTPISWAAQSLMFTEYLGYFIPIH